MDDDQHQLLGTTQKILARALDPRSRPEQKAAIRRLQRMIMEGRWQPGELLVVPASASDMYRVIGEQQRRIEDLEARVREKDRRILELAEQLQNARPVDPVAARVHKMELHLAKLEKQFGFPSMRHVLHQWHRSLTPDDQVLARRAARNWLRRHPGWEHGRVIPTDHGLRWRREG